MISTNKKLLSTDQKSLLSAFLPRESDITLKEIQAGCQNILKSIFINCPEKPYQNFPQAVKEATQLKICSFKEKIEKLDPRELHYVPNGCFVLNLFSGRGPTSKPATKLQVLQLLKNFVQYHPYLANELKEPLGNFFDKFLEHKGWIEELSQTKTSEFSQKIQEAVDCAEFLTHVNPPFRESLMNVFRTVVKGSLSSKEGPLLLILPKLAVLAEVSSFPLQDIPVESIELLKKIFADPHTPQPNRASCYALLRLYAPNFVNQKITVSLADGEQKGLDPLQCVLLRNVSDLPEGEITLALPQTQRVDFVQFWETFISSEYKRADLVSLNQWCVFFEIATLLKIQNLKPLIALLNESMLGNTLENFIYFLNAVSACIKKNPGYAEDCVNTRDRLISYFLTCLKNTNVEREPFLAALKTLNSMESDPLGRVQTIYVRHLTTKMMQALAQFSKQPALVFAEGIKRQRQQPNFFKELPRLKKLILPSNWEFEDLKAAPSLQYLKIYFVFNPTQRLGELLSLYPRLRELHLVQASSVPFIMPPELGEKYPNLKIFINNQEVFKGKNTDLTVQASYPIHLKRTKKRLSSGSKRSRSTPSTPSLKRKANDQPPIPAAATPPAAADVPAHFPIEEDTTELSANALTEKEEEDWRHREHGEPLARIRNSN